MTINPIELTNKVAKSYSGYLSGMFYAKDEHLRELIKNAVDGGVFVKGPYLEATPPFKAGSTIEQLIAEKILDPCFSAFIYKALPQFEKHSLHLHQDKAVRKISSGRNVVISSGTGSGKTECFLLPIYDHLLKEYREKGELKPGVRALLLYPMNALANDQLRRLREMAKSIERTDPKLRITFGRYTGETKDESRDRAIERIKKQYPDEIVPESELLVRSEMQDAPPHILITNYAMLEYLMLRPGDKKFFDGEYAHEWKFLVLDEAHIYTGAKSIEIAMLIRRLKDRVCESKKGHLRCIATSATLVRRTEDNDKVIKFASDLFGETFEFIAGDVDRQDIIEGQRVDISLNSGLSAFPLDLYIRLQELLLEEKDAEIPKTHALLKSLGIEKDLLDNAVAQANNSTRSFVHHVLAMDERLAKMKAILKDGAVDFASCIQAFQADDPDMERVRHAIVCMVNLAVWAKADAELLPLLPAKYHLFVRAPEGVFIALYPERKVFLQRREKLDDDVPVFELATCRKCGQEYLVGTIKEERLVHSFSELPLAEVGDVRSSNRYFMLWNNDTASDDNEDEEITFHDEICERGDPMELCTKCGLISKKGAGRSCKCTPPARVEVIEAETKKDSLNKCLYCCARSPFGIVEQFTFNQNELNTILVTELYQYLNRAATTRSEYKKVLTFSDSRHGAAYFAPYLGAEYDKVLYRRLIMQVVADNKDFMVDYGLETLTNDVLKVAMDSDLFPDEYDRKMKSQFVWRWIIKEFCGIFDAKRNSLESVGMLHFMPKFPPNWSPPRELMSPPWNLKKEEIETLYSILLDSLRYKFAITFPDKVGIHPKDDFFKPMNQEFYLLMIRDSKDSKKILPFIPKDHYNNTRLDFTEKVFSRITKARNTGVCKDLLGVVWKDLIQNWENKGVKKTGIKEGSVYQLDYSFWRIFPRTNDSIWYSCDICGVLTPHSLKNVCPTYNCTGTLHPIPADQFEQQRYEYFRIMYQDFKPVKMISKEHTAQLKPDYAAEIQQQFINGQVNVLNCSTTFELGVDLGTLETVFLRNVPPEPSNYVQRVGRAGRRTNSTGFTITFAHLRSHDLSFFKNPERLVDGRIEPPVASIRNEKILARHIHSIVLAGFFKLHEDYYGTANKLLRLDKTAEDGVKLIEQYLESKPPEIQAAVERVIPAELHNVLHVKDWGWTSLLVGMKGALTVARDKIGDEYGNLERYSQELLAKLVATPVSETKERQRITYDMTWADRRMETIRNQRLIDFLASNTVIPKYGFPVDVVDLLVTNSGEAAKQIELQRDLQIGLSEFAPGAEVVANGYIWKSEGIRRVKDREWPVWFYAICPECSEISMKQGNLQDKVDGLQCKLHGTIPNKEYRKFIIPEFGFVTRRSTAPKEAALFSPRREFSSRPYFKEYGDVTDRDMVAGNLKMKVRYAEHGELVILCKGEKNNGFDICKICGAAYAFGKHPKGEKKHESPFGWQCGGGIHTRYHLGHVFKTDIVSLTFIEPDLGPNENFGLSLLYTVLQGISEGLGIPRDDLDGCLHHTIDGLTLVLFDSVPGGAGHVKRLLEPGNLELVMLKALKVVDECSCGAETSCYGCLRHFRNQFCHHLLVRGSIAEFLKTWLGKGGPEAVSKELGSEKAELFLKIGRQGEVSAIQLLRKTAIADFHVNIDPLASIVDRLDGFSIKIGNEIVFDATWENANGESYKPYDIRFTDKDGESFIEVKSTASTSRDWFNISNDEWAYFIGHGDHYYIYRVYGVKLGEEHTESIEVIQNPSAKWRDGKILAFPKMIKI